MKWRMNWVGSLEHRWFPNRKHGVAMFFLKMLCATVRAMEDKIDICYLGLR